MARTHDELMERLAAANPIPDAERLTAEEEREAEALFARVIATPVDAPTRRGPAPRRRPARRLALAGAIACAAALALLLVLDEDGRGPGVIDQAVAAVTRADSVYHVVQIRRGTSNTAPDIGPFRVESWRASDGRLHEKVSEPEPGGKLLEEIAGRVPRNGGAGPILRYDPKRNTAYAGGIGVSRNDSGLPVLDPTRDPAATLAALRDEGLLHVEDETARAYRLVSDPIEVEEGEYRFEYLVDKETHLPLEQRYEIRRDDGDVLGFVSEFRSYERLPLNAENAEQLDLDPHPGMKCRDGAADQRGLGFVNPCPPDDQA